MSPGLPEVLIELVTPTRARQLPPLLAETMPPREGGAAAAGATASAPRVCSAAALDLTVQSLREQLARQSYAVVRARDMWRLLRVDADTAPSLLALSEGMVKVLLLAAAHAATATEALEESPRRLAAEGPAQSHHTAVSSI